MTTAAAAALSLAAALGTAEPLAVGRTIEREVTAGATHAYTIALDADDYLAGTVDAPGLALAARVFAPDGSPLREFAADTDGHGAFALVAETAGTYRLDVSATAAGPYRLA